MNGMQIAAQDAVIRTFAADREEMPHRDQRQIRIFCFRQIHDATVVVDDILFVCGVLFRLRLARQAWTDEIRDGAGNRFDFTMFLQRNDFPLESVFVC